MQPSRLRGGERRGGERSEGEARGVAEEPRELRSQALPPPTPPHDPSPPHTHLPCHYEGTRPATLKRFGETDDRTDEVIG